MGDYVLVPRVATEGMLDAAADCQEADPADGYASELHYAYAAMLAARPPVDYDALAAEIFSGADVDYNGNLTITELAKRLAKVLP